MDSQNVRSRGSRKRQCPLHVLNPPVFNPRAVGRIELPQRTVRVTRDGNRDTAIGRRIGANRQCRRRIQRRNRRGHWDAGRGLGHKLGAAPCASKSDWNAWMVLSCTSNMGATHRAGMLWYHTRTSNVTFALTEGVAFMA